MPSIVTISKTGSLKNAQNNDGTENLYKKCGFKKDTDFQVRHEWTVKVADEHRKIKLFARNVGRAGTENKYDLPPPIDHDHATGFIRGILSEKVNWLERQWELGSYGHLSKPAELTKYQENPPAFTAVGKVAYK